jgi:nitrile hydratase beta subunit
MNGIHDMGGLHGFGQVDHISGTTPEDTVFHSEWESRVFCITQVIDTKGIWNLDEHRHEIELMNAADYINDGYYGRWLFAMESLLNKKNILTHEEVSQRITEMMVDLRSYTQPDMSDRDWPLTDEQKAPWGACRHEESIEPAYSEGQSVRVRNIHPPGHTRVTAYTRGKIGTVERVNGQPWVLPDTRAHYKGENLQAVYTVKFTAQTLWGSQAESNQFLYIDLSEDHIESVTKEDCIP